MKSNSAAAVHDAPWKVSETCEVKKIVSQYATRNWWQVSGDTLQESRDSSLDRMCVGNQWRRCLTPKQPQTFPDVCVCLCALKSKTETDNATPRFLNGGASANFGITHNKLFAAVTQAERSRARCSLLVRVFYNVVPLHFGARIWPSSGNYLFQCRTLRDELKLRDTKSFPLPGAPPFNIK